MALNKREKGENGGTVDQRCFQVNPMRLAKTHNKSPALWPRSTKYRIERVTLHLTSPSAFIVKKPQEDGRCDILKAPLFCLASAWIQEMSRMYLTWWIDLASLLIDILWGCNTGLSPWLLTAICCGRLLFASGAQRRSVWRQRRVNRAPRGLTVRSGLSSHCLTPMGCGNQGDQSILVGTA